MIDLDETELACDELIANDLGYLSPRGANNAVSVKGLITRLRQAENDAARYRWLRDRAHTVTGITPCAFVIKDGDLMEDLDGNYWLVCMGELDSLVDEAISANKD